MSVTGGRIRVEVVRLPGGRVLLQVGGDWHLVVAAKDATVIAKLLHDAAHGEQIAVATITDLHAPPPPPPPQTPPLCDLHGET